MGRQRLSDRTVLIVAGCAYLPLVFLGYGSDGDSYSVVAAARDLMAGGGYHPSRAPGFPTHELATALLVPLGGSIATNLATLTLSLIALWALLRICAAADVPHRDLVALLVASNPYYWINSAATIDYVWALALSLAGLYAWMRGRPWLAGALFGLAAGARITSVTLPAAAVLTSLLAAGHDETLLARRHVPAVLIAFTAVAVALYALPFAWAGYSLSFATPPGERLLSYYLPAWGWQARLARSVYKNIYLFGLPAAVLLAGVSAFVATRRAFGEWRGIAILSCLAVAGCEVVFWIAPLEIAYLLPVLPFVALLIATTGHGAAPRWLWGAIALQLLYAVVNVSVLQPDVVRAATTAAVRPSLERGVVVRDVMDRLQGRLH